MAFLAGSFFPRVEDPWPDTIGLEFPVALSGGVGLLMGFAFLGSPAARRDRAMRRGALVGFAAGMLLYVASLAIQLGFPR